MLRALLYGLAVLHLGPGSAFAVLAFGCDPSHSLLGAFCEGDTLGRFLGLTASIWLVLGAVALVALRRREVKRAAVAAASKDGNGGA